MNRQVPDSGSKPDCARLCSCSLPLRLGGMVAGRKDGIFLFGAKKGAPTVIRAPPGAELGPAAGTDRMGRPQTPQRLLEAFRPQVPPPIHVPRMPALQPFEHLPVL